MSMFRRGIVIAIVVMTIPLTNFQTATAATSYLFGTAGATGTAGPNQSQLNSAYTGTSLQGAVTSNNGIQSWTVPTTGSYSITVVGAAGGAGALGPVSTQVATNGGLGMSITGTFNLSSGTVLQLIVGQKGINAINTSNGYANGGGGGGSFVYISSSDATPLIAAGGGGGGGSSAGMDAVATAKGTNGNGDTSGGTTALTAGNGGTLSSNATRSGGGGGGWLTDGTKFTSALCSGAGTAAQSPRNGALGGWSNTINSNGTTYGVNILQGHGGFGGGGAGNGACTTAGPGGGGGFSGGGGGGQVSTIYVGGGGGGSYNSGSSQIINGAINSGDGSILIASNSPAVADVSLNYLPTQVFRASVSLTAISDSPGRVTFFANNKKIPGCIRVAVSGSSPNYSAQCSWSPSIHGANTLFAIIYPSNGNASSASPLRNVSVISRSSRR
jgi:hypothetical protein